MKKKSIERVVAIFMCLLMLVGSNMPSYAKSVNEDNHADGIPEVTVGVEAVTIDISLREYLRGMVIDITESILKDPTYFNISDFSWDDLYIMEPYMGYVKQDDDVYAVNGIYSFPVVSHQKVLFSISVFSTPQGYSYSVVNDMGEQLNDLMGSEECYRVYIDHGPDNTKCEYQLIRAVSDSTDIQNREELEHKGYLTARNSQVLFDLSGGECKDIHAGIIDDIPAGETKALILNMKQAIRCGMEMTGWMSSLR